MYMIMTDRGWRPFHALNKPCGNSNDLQGVFRPVPYEQAVASNTARADRFVRALDTDQYGPSFRGNDFAEPISGAFGEKL